MARLTPKQKVLRKWPKAVITKWAAGYTVLAAYKHRSYGGTPRAAWADAAKRLGAKR